MLGEGGSGPATTRLGIDKAWHSVMRALRGCSRANRIEARGFCADACRDRSCWSRARWRRSDLKEIMHPFASVRFISDGLAACLGAHGGADGAVVVAGTGSIGVDLIGRRELRFGGYGFPISDEGSGADIGLQAIKLALRAADERGETSPLLEEVLGFFGA